MFIDKNRQAAEAFLLKVLPWGEPGAYFNLHYKTGTNSKNGMANWAGKPAQNLDRMMRDFDWLRGHPEKCTDIFVCMSSQMKTDTRKTANGEDFVIAYRSSLTSISLRSFYVDIDVKPGAYPDRNTALLALRSFCKAISLPTPTLIVSTGSGGIHAHWVLDKGIPVVQWQPIADALAEAVKVNGLIADTQCTVDCSRILRVPGSLNRKTETPRQVELLLDGKFVDLGVVESAVAPYHRKKVPNISGLTPTGNRAENDELGAGIAAGQAAPVNIDKVVERCAFIRNTLADGGAKNANPLWFMCLGLASFCEDGRKIAHDLSKGHPGYTKEETDSQFDRALNDRRTKAQTGWSSCSKYSSTGAAECATCPHFSEDKTPCHTGGQGGIQILPAKQVDMPSSYLRTQDGYVVQEREVEGGGKIALQVVPYPMEDGWLSDKPWTLHFTTKIGNRKREFMAELSKLLGMGGVTTCFAIHGMSIAEEKTKGIRSFIVAWIQKLQAQKDCIAPSTPYGWVTGPGGKVEGFTYAGKMWTGGEPKIVSLPDQVLASYYEPKGDVAKWREAYNIIAAQHRPALDAIIAASFGAPLMYFTEFEATVMSCYSAASGIGKSTAMDIAQAVWGDPKSAMHGLTDTPNSVLHKMGAMRTLPVFWDEIKGDEQTQKFSAFMFQLSGGKEKSRLTHDIVQRRVGTWQTMLVSASNESLIDAVTKATKSTTAGIYRLFEYPVPAGVTGQLEPGYVKRTVGSLRHHHGSIGLDYVKYLATNPEKVRTRVSKMYDGLRMKYNATSDERMWIATMACVLTGAAYANMLGFTVFNLKDLEQFLGQVLDRMRRVVANAPVDTTSSTGILNILSQYLNAVRARHTVRTNIINAGRGKPALGSVKVLSMRDKLEAIYVQVGQDDGRMRISSTNLGDWLKKNEYSRHQLTETLRDEYGMRITNARLCSGTDLACGMEYLLEIDLNHPNLAGFLEL